MRVWDKYNIIRNESQLLELDEYLMDDDGNPKFELIAFDTETNGLNFWENVVIGFSLSVNNSQGFYIPVFDWIPFEDTKKSRKVKKVSYNSYMEGCFEDVWNDGFYDRDVKPSEFQVSDILKGFVRRWFTHPKVKLLMHNAPFDVLMVDSNFGVDLASNLHVDTLLLKHVLDENTPKGLKETAILWQDRLGLNMRAAVNQEQLELYSSIIINGGLGGKDICRADPIILGKYAVADTFLTYGLYEVGMAMLKEDYSKEQVKWFLEDEVMPLCRELVIPMRREGVRIDVEYFEKMEKETRAKMDELEDKIIQSIGGDIVNFDIGDSIDESVSKKSLILEIMKLEALEHPTKVVSGKLKKSLDKPTVKKAYQENPHWLWGYILGEDELKYSDEKIAEIRMGIYRLKIGRKYRFNIKSDRHLRWIFCEQYGIDPKTLPQTDMATKDKPLASMKAEILREYFIKDYPWVRDLLLYKKHKKLHSTYILPALRLNNNGYLHMNWNQAGTISGRFSCSGGFNLQTLPGVEELDRCPECGSTNITIEYQIELLADLTCPDCDHVQSDILCPSAIKKGFISPDDYVIMNADYSSLEPRAFAYMSGDQGLKDVYQKNLDLYSKVYIDTEEPDGPYSADPSAKNFLKKLAPEKRKMVKPGVLGVPYGSGAWQLAKIMNFKKTILDRTTQERVEIVDSERGQLWIDKYLGTYPDLKKYMDRQELACITEGFVETIVGRRRHFKYAVPMADLIRASGITIKEFMGLKRKELDTTSIKGSKWFTKDNLKIISKKCGFKEVDKRGIPRTWDFVRAMFKNEINNSRNFPIQGLASHITNRGMIELQREFNKAGLRATVIMNVHDEVSAYVHKDDVMLALPIHKRCMEDNIYAKLIDVPMIADPIIANTLKEAK